MPSTRVSLVVCHSHSSSASASASVHAQAIHEGKVTGVVTSEDGVALPGATVEISSPALLAGTRIGHDVGERDRTCS